MAPIRNVSAETLRPRLAIHGVYGVPCMRVFIDALMPIKPLKTLRVHESFASNIFESRTDSLP